MHSGSFGAERPRAVLGRIKPCNQGSTGRRAGRIGAVCAGKKHALPCQTVEIWRFDLRIVDADRVVMLLVTCDE